ncbi:alpha-2-macroglobulin family protein [Microvirga sp. STR05]|uniref:Alpha-2-macroglobulin family protein n=1 Tax=Hymenobacter duratus TaxID=2771356 RepID=A0ABR8JG43_9BACT|nr:MG2 domain-containing protein [Hymenobacter duratus]MBD2715830.1 alpha-2-macroglobulin family protein [Hymenobacter duratus]MBR7950741.1 alpha-2-macroglobulin family protein [Microvirga sp. STR05]
MLFRSFSRLPLLVLLAVLCACSKSGSDAGQDPNGEEIDPYQNLVFQFADAVVTPELQDRWDTVQVVSFEPAVRGKFKWTSDRELIFSPSTPFKPSTAFKATLRKEALPEAKRNAELPENRQKFHTPYLEMQEPQAFWGRSSRAAGTAEMRVELPFNYAVKPADVKPLLRVTQDGQPVAFEVSGEPGEVVRVRLNQQVRPGTPLTVALAQGLHAVGSDQPSTTDYETQVTVPDPEALQVTTIEGSLKNADPMVLITTNQPVTATDLQRYLTVSPQVAYEVEEVENGVRLKGGFEVGRSYQIGVNQGLRGALGGMLGEGVTQTVSFSDERPTISFASADKAMYLDALGSRNLGVRINEVSQVKVTIAKVYANNIQQLLRGGTQYGYPEYDGEESNEEEGDGGEYVDHSFQYYDVENLGNVLTERTYTVSGLPKAQGLRLLNLNLKDLEFSGGLKGLYIIKVQDTERQWLQVSKLVAVSDIGLIVKQGKAGSTLVFANSIRNAKPLSGVELRYISTNNQVMGTGISNGDGVARFDSTAANGRFKLGMVMAQQGNDFTFLDLSRSRVETSRFEVGGLQTNAARYQAFLYGDRDLYRPGDTIQTNTVLRTDAWQAPPKGLPVKIRLLLPTGKEYASLQKQLNAAGSFEARFILPPAVMTGLYTLEVLTGNDVLLTSRQLSVEEFIPDRMKVTVKADRAVVKPSQSVSALITAQNLFGPPAADRKFEVEFSLKEKAFNPKGFEQFTFAINSGDKRRGSYGDLESTPISDRFEKTTREGTTDAAGRGTATYEVPDYTDIGTLEGAAFTTVFDETGRPVNRLATFEVQTQPVLFGIRSADDLVSTGQPLAVQLAALTPAGQPTTAQARVQVVRLLWETVIERQGGRYVYNSQKREEVVLNRVVSVKGAGQDAGLNFTPTYSGEYEIRVSGTGAVTYVARRLYAYGYGDTQSNSFEVNNEGEVTIEADKPTYEPGDVAHLLLKTPFPGRVLVTVERDRVLDHFYVNTDEKSAKVDVPIRGNHVPNIYVTATAIREIKDNRLPLTVARGFVPLTVEKPGARLQVAIKAPAQSRSQTAQTIEVTTAPGAQVTLAMVDEGILQMKDYRTPDPYGYFYQKRALEVQAYDVYPFLLPELGTSSTGGDGYDLSRRTTPVPNRRVRLLAKWSGVLTADASGKVRYKLQIPQFSGAIRIMAVAYKSDAFGSAEHTMKVADPVVISTALPRFLSPGDTIDVPVTLTNTTGAAIKGTVIIKVNPREEPLSVVQVGQKNFDYSDSYSALLQPGSEKRVVFYLCAKPKIGNAKVEIIFSTTGSKEIFTETIELPIRPASPLQKRTGAGVVAGGAAQQLNLRTDFLPSSLRSQLVVSRSPMTEFAKDLRYLLQYPYGCLEQTVSAAFPQLYYGDLAASLGQKTGKTGKAGLFNPNYHVQEAIRKVEAQQMYNGSLSYWPGGDYDNWWATAYAAHFLLEAQQAGFDVNKNVLDRVLRYLQARVRKRETDTYNIIQTGGVIQPVTLAKKEIAYSLYVLALAGRPDAVGLNYYKANRKLLPEDSRYLLAAAFALSGNQRSYREALPTRFGVQSIAGRQLGDAFSSPIRDEALVLNALLAADPANAQVNVLARQLSRQVKQAGWLSTQERAFALLALGKLARKNAGSTVTASLLADGKAIGNFSGKDLTVSNVANRQLALRTSGKGSLYYFWETEGISPTGQVREEDAYLQVRRQFLDRTGAPVGSTSFRQNDLVVVKITIQSAESAGEVKNVAITDLLPAGLEIENPRIGAVRDITWATDAAQPDYLDVRDDRINFFTTVTPTPKSFYYLCRAVSKGTFKLGPVSADAMYNAEYHSYSGSGVVRVR